MAELQKVYAGKGEKLVKTCCYHCHGGCILIAHVKDGKVVSMEGDPDGPHNRGTICEKGLSAPQYIHHPDRLLYPLKRVGRRGEGKWQRISWDEALNTVVDKLKYYKEKYGGEKICYLWGTGRVNDSIPFKEFFNVIIGSPNGMGIGHLCITKTRMPAVTMITGRMPPPSGFAINRDLDETKCIVGWGDTIIDSRNDYMGAGGTRVMDVKRKGAKIIAIDPVYTRLAQKADIWLQVRPGTDIALALAWHNIIINEGLYDKEFVGEWTNAPFLIRMDTKKLLRPNHIINDGSAEDFVVWDTTTKSPQIWVNKEVKYEKPNVKPATTGEYEVTMADGKQVKCKPVWELFVENVKEWTPEKAAPITWVPADKIREAARMYATTKPACIEWGVSMSQCTRSTATNMAIYLLEAITGNLDVRGGNPFWIHPTFKNVGLGAREGMGLTKEQDAKRITGGFPFSANPELTLAPSAWQPGAWKAMVTGEPYKPLMVFAADSNPLVGHEKPDKYVLQALRDELEFIVWTDIFLTPSNQYADIILPVCSPFERDWVYNTPEIGVFAGVKVIEPLGESKSDFFIFRELTYRMGYPEMWPWRTEEELCDWQLQDMGMTFKQLAETCFDPIPENWRKYQTGLLRPDKKQGFPTVSGKCEIYSSLLEKYNLEPQPKFSYPLQSYETTPELAEEYPLILITGARELNYPFFHSMQRQVPVLREMQPFPMMLIHPHTAGPLNIKHGNWVWVQTKYGKARFKALVSDRIHPKIVSVTHSWWYPELPPDYRVFDSSANVLVSPEPEHADSATGTTELRGLLCKIYKAAGPPQGVIDKEEQGDD
jgi:anaerobic selenocysteine-containing dehydrogenase